MVYVIIVKYVVENTTITGKALSLWLESTNQQKTPKSKRIEKTIIYLFKKYGITLEEYNTLWIAQGCKCKICNATENSKGFAVDHCHTTGKVRGILCDRCNLLLGKAHDNCTLLEKAISYLKSSLSSD